jgi:tetrahydromethanopterin S-methyltransferase subunit A
MQSSNIQPNEQNEGGPSWPVVDGSYRVGDPTAPIAVCALTSDELIGPLAHSPGVAIAGEVQTANLGIERIILNVTANPAIRFLLLCGKDSRLFRPGQTLGALFDNGIDREGRIVGAQGYEPVVRNLPREQVDVFRQQVELVDWIGEQDLTTLQERISGLAARNPGRFEAHWSGGNAQAAASRSREQFVMIRPGGQREPLIYDPKGYFVITLDRAVGQVVLRHYQPDHTPAHEMRGRSAESMLLGLLREGLVSQLSHAGYLGAELAKAEAALRLGSSVRYEQDRVLRQEAAPAPSSSVPAPAAPTASSAVSLPFTWKQLGATPVGEEVDLVCEVTARLSEHLFEGTLGEPSERELFRLYRRTEYVLRVHWSETTPVMMGELSQVAPGALLRVRGRRRAENEVDAERLVILTGVARVQEEPSGS